MLSWVSSFLRSRIFAICIFSLFVLSFFTVNTLNPKTIIDDKDSKNGTFDTKLSGKVKEGNDLTYVFNYSFYYNQSWATYVCVNSSDAEENAPLLVVVRQSLNVLSWDIPTHFNKLKHHKVCHTLCPLSNFFRDDLPEGVQEIHIDFSTSSSADVFFDLWVYNITDFVIDTGVQVLLNITPSEPRVLEYHLPDHINSVLVEAYSSTKSCMILAIQDVQCPFYDSERNVEYKGYYQTMTQQSGITVTNKFFPSRKVYIVLIAKSDSEECTGEKHGTAENRKEISIEVNPSLSNSEFYIAIFGALGFYISLYFFTFIICCFLYVRKKKLRCTHVEESSSISYINPSVQNYGTIAPISNETIGEPVDIAFRDVIAGDSIDESDFDKLPDAEKDKNVVRTKTILFVSDLSRKNEKYLSERTKVYSWNLLTIAIFYGLPVVQLVYINQKVVNVTGNQDLCYYNFLCSHKLGVFSDFNHIYSNLGYVMLGLLFLFLTWRRELLEGGPCEGTTIRSVEVYGIPHHFGLFYAMGFALIMEGVLSASYHVCPNKSNFQFDTAFMYVIATVCMLKLYQARHPDITAKAHHTWMILAVVLLICMAGVLQGDTLFWCVFIFGHILITFLVSTTIYYMGRWKLDKGLVKRIFMTLKLDFASRSFRPMYMGRFSMLIFAVGLNLALDMFGIIKRPTNFAAFLLAIFIVNFLIYLVYYTIMKIRNMERIRWIPLIYMFLSFLCWAAALHFFLLKNTSWQMTPARSRERNKHCVLLNFYDDHDIWHFLSSCALFFGYMVLFTLDDDLENARRNTIIVF